MTHGVCAAHEPAGFADEEFRSEEGTQVAPADEVSDALGSLDELDESDEPAWPRATPPAWTTGAAPTCRSLASPVIHVQMPFSQPKNPPEDDPDDAAEGVEDGEAVWFDEFAAVVDEVAEGEDEADELALGLGLLADGLGCVLVDAVGDDES
ncbi:MAG TPA: hypothetical protein VGM10_28435 [Actinocrinis sp.]|jgi:hypothetical protein